MVFNNNQNIAAVLNGKILHRNFSNLSCGPISGLGTIQSQA